jgi:hypothetical protein
MKKILVPAIVIIVIIIVALVLRGSPKKNSTVLNPTVTPAPAAPATEVKNGLTLAGFPTDIAVEVGASVVQSSSVTNAAGQIVATYEFISKKTIAENFMFYKNSLPPNRWAISIVKDSTTQKIIEAIKGKVQAEITIAKNQSNRVVVSIQATTSK